MSETGYDRAVAMFEALVAAPSRQAHRTPASLIQDAGVSVTSGYRNTAALEAEGFLRRDAAGVYLPGGASVRTGLNACGAGRIAPVIEPILLRLRTTTKHTAFLGVLRSDEALIGPYCIGRATGRQRLDPLYRLEARVHLAPGTAEELTFVTSGGEAIARRIRVLTAPLEETPERTTVLGLLLNPSRPPQPSLAEALVEAAGHLSP